eukprot:PLAT14614.1.p1 GENE.PLAT14614.1~~PLAT14614.1.p1  ORF type:complete len:546 (+),score=267.14 PLAT14614.1:287-1924(+)
MSASDLVKIGQVSKAWKALAEDITIWRELLPAPLRVRQERKLEGAGSSYMATYRKLQQGVIFTWGNYDHAQQLCSLQPLGMSPLRRRGISQLACGALHTVAVTYDGAAYSWGKGWLLGLPRVRDASKPKLIPALRGHKVQHVSASSEHTVVTTGSGLVFTWGRGAEGQLGHGGWGNVQEPAVVRSLQARSIFAAQAAVGNEFSLIRTQSGDVYAWGAGSKGQLGTQADVEEGFCIATPARVATLSSIVHVAAGYAHAAAVTARGQLFAWGSNASSAGIVDGRLGLGSSELLVPTPQVVMHSVVDVECGYAHTVAIDYFGDVLTWGWGAMGQLGLGLEDERPVVSQRPRVVLPLRGKRVCEVACGWATTMAVTADGQLFAWGEGEDGQLGLRRRQNVAEPRLVAFGGAQGQLQVEHIACGQRHTVALVVGAADELRSDKMRRVPAVIALSFTLLLAALVGALFRWDPMIRSAARSYHTWMSEPVEPWDWRRPLATLPFLRVLPLYLFMFFGGFGLAWLQRRCSRYFSKPVPRARAYSRNRVDMLDV